MHSKQLETQEDGAHVPGKPLRTAVDDRDHRLHLDPRAAACLVSVILDERARHGVEPPARSMESRPMTMTWNWRYHEASLSWIGRAR